MQKYVACRLMFMDLTVVKNDVFFVLGIKEKCRNPSLGFVTKARACKGVGQE